MGSTIYNAIDTFMWFLFFVLLYFVPTIVAGNRIHPQTGAIFVLNLCLGWTLVGWVIALVWANTNELS